MISTGCPPSSAVMEFSSGLSHEDGLFLDTLDPESLFEGLSEQDWSIHSSDESSNSSSSPSEGLIQLDDFAVASGIKVEVLDDASPSTGSPTSVLSDNDICELLDVHLDSLSDLASQSPPSPAAAAAAAAGAARLEQQEARNRRQKEQQQLIQLSSKAIYAEPEEKILNGGRDIVLASAAAAAAAPAAKALHPSQSSPLRSFSVTKLAGALKPSPSPKPVVVEAPEDDDEPVVSHCSVCKLVFSSGEQLREHQLCGLRTLRCCMCDKAFPTATRLTAHHRKHSKEKPFRCDSCGKNYTHRTTLARHQLHYCTTLRAKCEDGQQQQLSKQQSKQEQLLRVQPPSTTALLSTLRQHSSLVVLKQSDDGLSAETKCKICDKEFFDAVSLSNHTNLHLGNKTCCLCLKVLGNKSKLLTHHRVHTKESPYACSICDKRFSEHSTLKKHLSTHGAKCYKCDLCGKSFARKDYLAKHTLTHQQTYKCSECSYVCHTRRDIERHVGIHSDMLSPMEEDARTALHEDAKLFVL